MAVEGAGAGQVNATARMQVGILPGGRLHLNDGPIDLVIGADGDPGDVRRAFAAATTRFSTVLDELCSELTLLRSEMRLDAPLPAGAVAQRMDRATRPLSAKIFITRMAAVAGAVADEVLDAMVAAAPLARASVNNGGDIALHLADGERFVVGLVARPDAPRLFGEACIHSAQDIRGIATSGWRGRSFSLGIADAVTILAGNAASADAAATLVANAVDLPAHPTILRERACDLDPESDLEERFVTRGVGALDPNEIAAALRAGALEAHRLIRAGAIQAAALHLSGATQTVGRFASPVESDRQVMLSRASP